MFGRSNRLGNYTDGRDNNLNLLRMLAAIGVLVSHSVPLTLGSGPSEPLTGLLGYSLGGISVWIFFGISGLLICQSFERRTSTRNWVLARVLRIYPALIVVVSLTVVLAGPVWTTLSITEYFSSKDTWQYLLGNATLTEVTYPLPGVFEESPYPDVVNGSIWTLPVELACYAAVLLFGTVGLFKSPKLLFGTAIVLLFLYFWDAAVFTPFLGSLRNLGGVFALGAAAYFFRNHLPLRLEILGALGVLAAAIHNTPFYDEVLKAAVVYAALLIGYVPRGWIRSYNLLGDYSYGIYVYAFPVQQTMAFALAGSSPYANLASSLPITLLFAIFSWHLVEKPALGWRHKLK